MDSVLTAELVVDGLVPKVPRVSPDGRWVAYVTAPVGHAGERPTGDLWVVPGAGGEARKLASGNDLGSPRWAPDSRSVYYLVGAQVHRAGVLGGAPEVLTSWSGGVDECLPLDAGRVVVIAPDGPTEEDRRREAERDDAGVRGERARLSRLRTLDPRTGEIRTPDVLGGRHVVEVAARSDGLLAVVTWPVPDLDPGVLHPELHVVDLAGGTVRDLGSAAVEARRPVWWRGDDGWHVSYLGVVPPGLVGGCAVFDVTEDGVHRDLTTGMTSCPADLATGPLALFADGLDTVLRQLDPATLEFVEVSRIEGQAESLSVSRNGDVVAAVVSTAYEPKNIHIGQPGGLAQVTDTRPELRGVRWGVQERLAHQADDGLALDGLLVLPPGRTREDGPFPLVTLVHGGPYDRHADRLMLDWYPSAQWLAAAGLAVFLPNARGGKGHGHDFAACVAGAVGLDEWTDVLAGLDLLVAQGVADPERLGIGGWSHGGFVAAWAVGQTDRFQAAVMGAGVSDWGMLAATGESGPFEAALGGSAGWEGIGPHPHDRLSPISFAANVRTPVLMLHGADDTNVPLSQSEAFHRALRRFGAMHEFVVYPREGHSIRERNHQLDVLRRTRDWFCRWL
ncbi:S9 family peptidase [Lentzea tibetensis]|uniref:S9 family peptidase n=2 Tax=Lentzea tibetensis TaxID=2591470 RepID=A0A563EL52_9PSEU|nr:S9 family peptidase [Lentzea tibetensis]